MDCEGERAVYSSPGVFLRGDNDWMSEADSQQRKILLDIYAAALQAVDGRRVVRDYLQHHPVYSEVNLIAIGKAAASMTRGALDVLDADIRRALIITKNGHCDPSLSFECLQSGHPVPDGNSLIAGERLLRFVTSVPAGTIPLFLISGGSSSLVEVASKGVGLDELSRVNSWLLGSGLDIAAMNAVRKRISCIKGGRLAKYLCGRRVLNLMISDVVGDDPATIGSGLLTPDSEQNLLPWEKLPRWLQELCRREAAAPEADASCFRSVESVVLANNRQATEAAAMAGSAAGLPVYRSTDLFHNDALQLGKQFARQVLEGPSGLYIWGGESTVTLPPSPGRGGRNQSLALAAAQVLAGNDAIFFLAAGTDGTDGPTESAGALVDGGTVIRGRCEGLDAGECLSRADAGTFLEASGDLICTGPTGTNVMDLVLSLKI